MDNQPYPGEQINQPCVLCGHSQKAVLFETDDYMTRDPFWLIQCQVCRLVETAPRPQPEKMNQYYPDEYFGLSGRRFLGPGEMIIRLARLWRADAIHRYFRLPGRVLDIGCGRGWMLAKLKQLGWECYGTEWSETLVKLHQQNGLQVVRELDLRDCHFPDQFFDAVTLWHVFEHIPNPVEILSEIHRILKPGGLIVLATPDVGGLSARLTRQAWFSLDVPRHLFHYSHNTLAAIIERAGFRILRRRYLSIEQDLFSTTQSALNAMGFSYNRFYNVIRNNTARSGRMAHSASIFSQLVFWSCALALLAPCSAASVLFSLFQAGGTIEMWATRTATTEP